MRHYKKECLMYEMIYFDIEIISGKIRRIIMVTPQQIQLFMSIFRGRNNVYARYWEKNGKSGYSPAYQFNWSELMAFKAKGGRFSDFPNKKPLLLTFETIQSHLNGSQTIGIYPLFEDNTSYFIAADFDGENWIKESKEFIKTCKKYSVPVYLERSRSGKGSHVWIFFAEKYPAFKSRAIVLELIRQSFKLSQFDKEVSFDRLFPNQDYHNTSQSFGNLIALPLHGISLNSGNTAFLDPDIFEVIDDQWRLLACIKKLSTINLNDLYERLVKKNENCDDLVAPKRSKSKRNFEIIIDHQIVLKKEQLRPQQIRFLREQLNFFNTEYLIKKKIGVSTYQTEKFFKLIQEKQETILLPRGFVSKLVSFCQESEIPFVLVDKRNKLPEVKFKSKINLYDYQKAVINEIAGIDSGVIVAPSGSGKTVIGLELITQKSQPTLILVHRKQLLDQWVERIQSFLGIPKAHIGRISGIKKAVGKQITVAMMQSLIKMKNINELSNIFGTIIVDECHHIPAKTFRELICQFNPYYLYGLTATPKRKYNDERLIYYYIGDIIATVVPNFGKEEIPVNTQIEIHIKETDLSVPFNYQTDEFEIVSKILIFDNTRNKQITEDIILEAKKGLKILVLTERKEHVEILYQYLKGQMEIITLTGEDSASKRVVKMDQLKAGHFQILIATGQLLGEGMDFGTINCLFLVYPFSFEGKLIQYIGRIQRSKSQKAVYDYRDKNISFFERLFKNRLRYYKKIDCRDLYLASR